MKSNHVIWYVLFFSLHIFQPFSQQWHCCFSWPQQDSLQYRPMSCKPQQTQLWPHSSATVSLLSVESWKTLNFGNVFCHRFSSNLWSTTYQILYIFICWSQITNLCNEFMIYVSSWAKAKIFLWLLRLHRNLCVKCHSFFKGPSHAKNPQIINWTNDK